nr:PREDICTED: uncharacterized protein C12orf29 homolog isoform X3 [Latimeria chalumnae]|eukprot:XP_006011066.1 PREDICTED: uncharacterized protein C12orf29 homolog isoform X3 [Latimeria chalumnae]
MRRLGAVKQKIPCVFLTKVIEEPSAKRDQPFQILASETLNPKALEADLHNAIPTEKVDGTCCYVTTWKGQQYLWARLDRKPNKQAEKRFRKFQHSGKDPKEFSWNTEDFKAVPESWIPALGILQSDGHLLPDENGHTPGWVPVEKNNKQYCWHSAVVNYEVGVALLLRPHSDGGLEITMVPLTELQEQTLELIGTNINANPYANTVPKRLSDQAHPARTNENGGIESTAKAGIPLLTTAQLGASLNGFRDGSSGGYVSAVGKVSGTPNAWFELTVEQPELTSDVGGGVI